ncbi:MAG: hypothetical protein GF398_21075 [Chitinivibrionales bacterium]|nr:hypothetical protein [Chitinivibrionales bacterium]
MKVSNFDLIPKEGKAFVYGLGKESINVAREIKNKRRDITVKGFIKDEMSNSKTILRSMIKNAIIPEFNNVKLWKNIEDLQDYDFIVIPYCCSLRAVQKMSKRNIYKYLLFDNKKEVTRKQMINANKNIKSYFLERDLGKKYYFEKSRSIRTFISTRCNAKCVFCAASSSVDAKFNMGIELFENVVRQFLQCNGCEISLSPNIGDPLVDKGFCEKVELAKNMGIKSIKMSTNGILLANEKIRQATLRFVSKMNISLPSFQPKEYSEIFGVEKGEQVAEGLLKLLQEKEQINSKVIVTLGLRLARPLNEVMSDEEMSPFLKYVKTGMLRLNPLIEMDNWSGTISDANMIGIMYQRKEENLIKDVPCTRIMKQPAVLPDGMIRLCACRYYRSNYDDLIVGDINEEPLKNIIFGKRHKEIIKNWIGGDLPVPCRQCTLYEPYLIAGWASKYRKIIGKTTGRIFHYFS